VAAAAAAVSVGTFAWLRFSGLYDVDIRKNRFQIIAAAFRAFDQLIFPFAD